MLQPEMPASSRDAPKSPGLQLLHDPVVILTFLLRPRVTAMRKVFCLKHEVRGLPGGQPGRLGRAAHGLLAGRAANAENAVKSGFSAMADGSPGDPLGIAKPPADRSTASSESILEHES
jgi:hypothetical protein